MVREAVSQATRRIEQVELDLNDQVHQARRCIQELKEKRDNFEVQMATTAAVNKQLLFLEEKVSGVSAQTGTLHAPPSPCPVRVRGLARASTAHRVGESLSSGDTDFYNSATWTRAPTPDGGAATGPGCSLLTLPSGPKTPWGHNRQDPYCVAMNGGEALAFLKKKRGQTITSSPPTTRSTRSPRARPTTSQEPPAAAKPTRRRGSRGQAAAAAAAAAVAAIQF